VPGADRFFGYTAAQLRAAQGETNEADARPKQRPSPLLLSKQGDRRKQKRGKRTHSADQARPCSPVVVAVVVRSEAGKRPPAPPGGRLLPRRCHPPTAGATRPVQAARARGSLDGRRARALASRPQRLRSHGDLPVPLSAPCGRNMFLVPGHSPARGARADSMHYAPNHATTGTSHENV
jgi:hypothetical protein